MAKKFLSALLVACTLIGSVYGLSSFDAATAGKASDTNLTPTVTATPQPTQTPKPTQTPSTSKPSGTTSSSGSGSSSVGNTTNGQGGTTTSPGGNTKLYTATIQSNQGGKVLPKGTVVVEDGGQLVVSVTPDDGYQIKCITVNGSLVEAKNIVYLEKVQKNTVVAVTFEKAPAEQKPVESQKPIESQKPEENKPPVEEWTNPYKDVSEGQWHYEYIKKVSAAKYMNGVSSNSFSPDTNLTRAMLVTVLHRMAGTPAATKDLVFEDVGSDKYYTEAVKWASENGIVNGYTEKTFGPEDPIIREQLVTILYRFAQYKKMNVDAKASLESYNDANNIAPYAADAFQWCVAQKIVNGTSGSALSPKNMATRAEVAAVISRFSDI